MAGLRYIKTIQGKINMTGEDSSEQENHKIVNTSIANHKQVSNLPAQTKQIKPSSLLKKGTSIASLKPALQNK